MICFNHDKGLFNLRVAGLVFHHDHVLLHHALHELFWTVPGGRCEMMENTAATVRREFAEELGVDVQVERLVALVENFFEYESTMCHELCFYYSVTLPAHSPLLDVDRTMSAVDGGVPLEFRWFPVGTLHEVEIRPTCLVEIVRANETEPGIRHILHAG